MRFWRCRSLSAAGDLSTMYDIQACLEIKCQIIKLPSVLSGGEEVRWRTIQVQSGNCKRNVSKKTSFPSLKEQPTGQTHGPCSQPSGFALPFVRYAYTGRLFFHPMADLSLLRGSSSSRFSKYLLPYLSMPISVPALVSPVSCESASSVPVASIPAYQCSKRAGDSGQFLCD